MARTNCWVCGNSYDGWECPVCSRNRLAEKSAREAEGQHREHMEALEEASQQRAEEAARLEELMEQQREAMEEAAAEAQQAAEEALEEHRRTTANAWKLQSEAKSERAYALYNSGMFEEARKLALQSIEQDPGNFDGFWVVVSALISSGKATDARPYVEKLIQLLNLPEYRDSPSHFIQVLDLLSSERNHFLLESALSSTLRANARYFTDGTLDLVKELAKLGMLSDAKWLLQSILARSHSGVALDVAFELAKRFVSEKDTAAAMDIVEPLLRNAAHSESLLDGALALFKQFQGLGDTGNAQRIMEVLSSKSNGLLSEAFLLDMNSCLGKGDKARIDAFIQRAGIESRQKLEADLALIRQKGQRRVLSEATVASVTQSLSNKYRTWKETLERQLADAARTKTAGTQVKTHGGWVGVVSFVGLMMMALAFCFSLGFRPESTGPYFAFGTLFGAILVGSLFGRFEKKLKVGRESNRVLASSFESENRQFAELGLPTLSPRSADAGAHFLRFAVYAAIGTAYVIAWFALMAGSHSDELSRASNIPVQMGTTATCSEVLGFGRCTRKRRFRPGEPVWVYSEVRNVNRGGQISVAFDIDLIGPNGFRRKAHFDQGGSNVGDAWSVDNAKFQLPGDSPAGQYSVQVTARNKLSGQVGRASADFVVSRGTQHEPEIRSVDWTVGQSNHKLVISGIGLGDLAPFDGDSPYILVTDVTRNWNAGHDGDWVTVDVAEWNDSRITVNGFGSAYGRGWSFETGDTVRVEVWNPETKKGPASATLTVPAMNGLVPGGASQPTITSVSRVYPRAVQKIIIAGTGFGEQVPYDGDSPYILITDMTQNWNAGNPGDLVTLKVTSWTESEIVLEGFTGYYGTQWSLSGGDSVRIQVWNVQTQRGPATITTTVSPE
jgi:tetratricopeptide (TPR) repeat protein